MRRPRDGAGPRPTAAGFSLLEALIALGLLLLLTGGLLALSAPVGGFSRTVPEMAAVQQRLRVAFEQVYEDVLAAGQGTRLEAPGSLARVLPAVLPYRLGRRAPAAPHRDAGDSALTLLRVPRDRASETTTLTPAVGPRPTLALAAGPGCGPPACGFSARTLALLFDPGGAVDLFRVVAVGAMTVTLERLHPASTTVFGAGAIVAPLELDHYYLDAARAELRRYDGWRGDFPLVDNVVGFHVGLLGVPPAAGDPCLAPLTGSEGPLAALPRPLLVDGPWCGPPGLPFDADLRRVRAVTITLRVQTADRGLRGPDPALFARPGPAVAARGQVPDLAVRVSVAPRNLGIP